MHLGDESLETVRAPLARLYLLNLYSCPPEDLENADQGVPQRGNSSPDKA